VAAEVIGSGSEHGALLHMVDKNASVATPDMADAGCHSNENLGALREQCLRHPQNSKVRQEAIFAKGQPSPHEATALMKRAIDSQRGRRMFSARLGTVEPVFANLRHNKRPARFNLRGRAKVNMQWHLYCMVHNIEKIAKALR
jgi:hypothetical protein